MRTIQEIFDAVIKAGCYPFMPTLYYSTSYMCCALGIAYRRNVITIEEATWAVNQIFNYLNSKGSLVTVLAAHDLPYDSRYRLAIYKDWANRPVLSGRGITCADNTRNL